MVVGHIKFMDPSKIIIDLFRLLLIVLKMKNFLYSWKAKRDFLFIGDFTNFIFKYLHNKRCLGEIINVGFGNPIEIKKVIEKIRKKINSGYPEFGKITLRKDEQKKCFLQ